MKNWKLFLFVILSFIFSFGLGWIFHDQYFIGSATLFLGFVETLLMTKGKWYEGFFGLFETIASTIVCVFAGLFGSLIFTCLIYIPIAIFSLVNWKKNDSDGDGVVDLNKMTVKKSLIIVVSLVLSSLLISYLLSLIPKQNLPVFDTVTNLLNIIGILLLALRYKEGWIFWLLCNLVELAMWIVLLTKGYSNNAIMMILTSVVYTCLNIWGFVSFIKLRKKQEKDLYKLDEKNVEGNL